MAEATPTPALTSMTFEEFLVWGDEDTHAEWVEGRVVPMSPVNFEHADLVSFLNAMLRYAANRAGGGAVCGEPFLMKLGPNLPARSPDVLFLREEHRDRIKRNHLEGPADLAIEVVSPGSRGRDRGEKHYEYEQAGVTEYWLIDPQRRRAEFYRLDEHGQYQSVAPDADGIIRSTVLEGLWLRVEWFWSPPRLRDVFAAWEQAG
jgi:Uma2 family endonuclease